MGRLGRGGSDFLEKSSISVQERTLLCAAGTRFHFPQSLVCCVLHNGCETPGRFTLLSSTNRLLQCLRITAAVMSREIWRQVEKPSGKASRICTKRRGELKAGSERLPGLSFVLGRHEEKGFPLKENFLTERTVSSLYRKRVCSLGSVFVFSVTKSVVKSQR